MIIKRNTLIAAATGAAGAAAGLLPLARCSAGTCASCYGCAGIVIALALTALFKRPLKRRTNHGLAQDGN